MVGFDRPIETELFIMPCGAYAYPAHCFIEKVLSWECCISTKHIDEFGGRKIKSFMLYFTFDCYH